MTPAPFMDAWLNQVGSCSRAGLFCSAVLDKCFSGNLGVRLAGSLALLAYADVAHAIVFCTCVIYILKHRRILCRACTSKPTMRTPPATSTRAWGTAATMACTRTEVCRGIMALNGGIAFGLAPGRGKVGT